jgi:hypothetical protein
MNEPTNDNDIDALLAFLGRMAMPKQHAALTALVAERNPLAAEVAALKEKP